MLKPSPILTPCLTFIASLNPKSLFYQPCVNATHLASLGRTLVALDPGQILQCAPVQVDNRANDHDMHYLVAIAPVVKQAWDEALRDLDDVDHPTQYSQRVHDHKQTQGVWAAHAAAVDPEQEEAEAEQSLPDEGSQAQDVGAGRGGTVDPVN